MSRWTRIRKAFAAYFDEGDAGVVKKVIRAVQLAVALIAAVLLAGWSIAPVRALMERHDLFDDASVMPIIGVLFALTVSILDDLFKRTKSMAEALETFAPAHSSLIPGGIGEVYKPLFDELKEVPETARTLDVFGLTLYTAWPPLEQWLGKPETSGWRIRMLCLSPELAETRLPGIPAGWYEDAKHMIAKVEEYRAKRADALKSRDITLELHRYRSYPAIHGFLLGNGTLFVSCLQWEKDGDELAKPHHFYEKFEASDRSERAECYRALFSSWLDHALATAAPKAAPAAPKVEPPVTGPGQPALNAGGSDSR